jgi:hypothetical protein
MRWPFQQKRPTADVRAFRDPKTGKVTLRLDGQLGLPTSWEEPILVVDIRLEAPLSDETAVAVRDQLNHLIPVNEELEF